MFAQREGDVLEHGLVGEERAELEQHAHLPAQRVQAVARLGADIRAAEQHLAAIRLDEPADQTKDRRLAAARPAHDRDHLATRETHVQVGQNEPVAVTEVDVAKLKQGLGESRHGSGGSFYARGRIIGPVRKRCAGLPFDEITFPNFRHYRANVCCNAATAAAVSCASVTARTTAALPTPVASTSRNTSPFTPPIATSGTRPSSNRT